MTASPITAERLPGTLPDAAGSGGGGVEPADGLVEEPPTRRRRKVLLLLLLGAAFVLLLGLSVWYLVFRQPIPVPTLPGETIMPGYVTSLYGSSRPMGVAVNAAGDRIYVGETSGDQVARVFDAQGNELGAMLPPVSTGTDHVPVYLAVDPLNGEVYVSDRPTASVYVYDSEGTYLREFRPTSEIAGWQPLGMAFDKAGNLYITDVGNTPQVVRVFDRTGTQIREVGAHDRLLFPNGLAVDEAGNVYVADSNNGRLVVFTPDGTLAARVGRGVGEGNLGLPRGIALDAQGRVYVADSTGQSVFVYGQLKPGEARLEYLGYFGGQGVANGQFQYPNSIAVDGRGRLYVADSINDRVQLWSY